MRSNRRISSRTRKKFGHRNRALRGFLDFGSDLQTRDDAVVIIAETRYVRGTDTDRAREGAAPDIRFFKPFAELHQERRILPSVKFIKGKNSGDSFTLGFWRHVNDLAYLHPMARKRTKPKTVTHFLREWREYRGLSQERLAARIDMSTALISRLENGDLKFAEETLIALADALQCEPGDILSRDPNSPDFQLWRIINGLRPDEQQQALRVIEALVKKSA